MSSPRFRKDVDGQETVRQSLTATEVRTAEAIARNTTNPKTLHLLDPALDIKWSKDANGQLAASSYYDYYFSGQDVCVYVDGAESSEYGELPIMDFAFNIQQQKTPVYGFWSYTYDAVMRGTRIVTGQFRIATKSTDYMKNLISEAAAARVQKKGYDFHIRGLDTDEANIEKYWHRNVDPYTLESKRIFSSHPPFNFVCVYGMQSTSIVEDPTRRADELRKAYNDDDYTLMMDQNERLVSDPITHMRFVIENVELNAMQVEYTPDGAVCSEVYSFFARDIFDAGNTGNVR